MRVCRWSNTCQKRPAAVHSQEILEASFGKQDESTTQDKLVQDRITRLSFMEADSVVRKAMGEQGIVFQSNAGGMFVQHPASEVDSRRSIYSGPWYHLKVDEWYSSDVTMQVNADDKIMVVAEENVEETPWETRFHGTVFKAFLSVLKDGGLVAGPNGHSYKGKTLLGMFCCKNLSDAFLRVAPGRGISPSMPGAGLDLGCMPVVVELSAVLLEKVPPSIGRTCRWCQARLVAS